MCYTVFNKTKIYIIGVMESLLAKRSRGWDNAGRYRKSLAGLSFFALLLEWVFPRVPHLQYEDGYTHGNERGKKLPYYRHATEQNQGVEDFQQVEAPDNEPRKVH